MKICLLASGSNGNACYVEAAGLRLLIDVGIGPRVLAGRMAPLGCKPADLTHLFLTHEHTDHISGVLGLLKRNPDLPIYGTRGTLKGLPTAARKNTVQINSRVNARLGPVTVHAFRTSHDCAQPVGYRVETPSGILGYATDLGMFSKAVIEGLGGCDALVVEANHCPDMLRTGPYPPFLKDRVASKRGHLSNQQSSRLLEQVLHSGLAHVTLAHLSATNNRPEAVWQAMAELTERAGPRTTWALGSRRGPLEPVAVENRRGRPRTSGQTELQFSPP